MGWIDVGRTRDVRLFQVAVRSDANVLIQGATGTGKSTLARKIHASGSRAGGPFVVVNLAAIHAGTLESELFGHEQGAYTGATRRRKGLLASADGGTVFLDEIGDMSPDLQGRLLEFLQSKTIVPVGGDRAQTVDARVIAATHRDLQALVRSGRFREDLLHRLRVIELRLPELKDRAGKFDAIVHQILEENCKKAGRRLLRLSEEAAVLLEKYSWPGNYRELHNVLEFAVHASEEEAIGISDLPEWFVAVASGPSAQTGLVVADASPPREESAVPEVSWGVSEVVVSNRYEETIARFEKQYLERALTRFEGKINHTARMIGMNKTTLMRRMRVHGLKPRRVGGRIEFHD